VLVDWEDADMTWVGNAVDFVLPGTDSDSKHLTLQHDMLGTAEKKFRIGCVNFTRFSLNSVIFTQAQCILTIRNRIRS